MTDCDKFVTVTAICKNIAVALSKCVFDCYLRRVAVLTELEQRWKDGYDVKLTVISRASQQLEQNASPQLDDENSQILIKEETILTSLSCSVLNKSASIKSAADRNNDHDSENNDICTILEPEILKLEVDEMYDFPSLQMDCSEENFTFTTKQEESKISSNKCSQLSSLQHSDTKEKNTQQLPCRSAKRSLPVVGKNAVEKSGVTSSNNRTVNVSIKTDAENDNASKRRKITYACDSCNLTFPKLSLLQEHVKVQHDGVSFVNFLCSVCDKSFRTAKVLRKHILIHRKSWSCHLCDLKFSKEHHLQDHLDTYEHEEVQILNCLSCDLVFFSYASLRQHSKFHKNRHCCKKCNSSFVYRYSLRKHVRKEHSDELSDKNNPSELLEHIEMNNATVPLKYNSDKYKKNDNNVEISSGVRLTDASKINDINNSITNGITDVVGSKSSKNDIARHLCAICNKPFSSLKILNKHLHLRHRRWICQTCGRVFSTKYFLTDHERTHGVTLDLKCSSCAMKFSSCALLTEHRKIHRSNHRCNECRATFVFHRQLEFHVKKFHSRTLGVVEVNDPEGASSESISCPDQKCSSTTQPELGIESERLLPADEAEINLSQGLDELPRDFACPTCPRRYFRQCALKKHSLCHNKRWRCNVCSRAFANSYELKDHTDLHEISKSLKCLSCDMKFANLSLLTEHSKRHKGNHSCANCGVTFSHLSKLKNHVLKNNCFDSSRMQNGSENMTTEIESSLSKEQIICTSDAKSLDSSLANDAEINLSEGFEEADDDDQTGDDSFTCAVCLRAFDKKYALKKHMLTHDKRWACKLCNKAFTHSYQLKEHADLHEILQSLKCLTCNAEFVSDSLLAEHSKTHKNDHRCKFCDCSFAHLYRLKYHVLKTHSATETAQTKKNLDSTSKINSLREPNVKNSLFSCVQCDRSFSSSKMLDHHMRMHNTRYECTICRTKFPLLSKLQLHMDEHGVAQNLNCLSCDEKFDSYHSFSSHIKTTHAQEFKCRECDLVFKLRYKLKNHVAAKHSDATPDPSYKPYVCSVCGKCFRSLPAFSAHSQLHSDEKRYRCEVCDKAFFQAGALRDHAHSHSAFKPHVCNVCARSFVRPNHLRVHLRLHTGERPYACAVCDKKFRTPAETRNHARIHSDAKTYACPVCKEMFKTMNGRQRHMPSHSDEFSYRCAVCDKRFFEDRNLQAHVRTHSRNMSNGQRSH